MIAERTTVPRVSVCIPTHNRSGYLREALESAQAQTFGDFELLVIDDASTDDTPAVVQAYAAGDGRIQYVRNPNNLGYVGNWNRCVALARGEYVALLHDDDAWLPGTLAATVGALDAHPAAAFVYGVAEEMDDAGRPVGLRRSLPADAVLPPARAFAHLLAFNSVPFPTVLVRASAYAAAGPYEARVGFAADWDMWLRLASRHPVVYLDRVLARYRLSDDSVTTRLDAAGLVPSSLRLVIERALAAPPAGRRPPRGAVRRARRWAGQTELALAFAGLYRGDGAFFRAHTRAALTTTPEVLWSAEGAAAVVLSVASLFGQRGPRLLWWLRDQVGRRRARGRVVAASP